MSDERPNQNPLPSSDKFGQDHSFGDRYLINEEDLENRVDNIPTSAPTGGDWDANQYQAEVVGEEAVGGQTPTPGQVDVDRLGQSMGIEMRDREVVAGVDKLNRRDENRWELDPDSVDLENY
ncbi:MAG: hypothetical protein HC890_13190 [Chloroflexaceae bacterium]|nr:hypothetical protein [Chloroflexaceae bacterium]